VGPVESVLTYWMLPFLCQTSFKIYAPANIAIIAIFVIQNCYLHCGVRIDWLERIMITLHMVRMCIIFIVNHDRRRSLVLWQ
jgi:hypothetical protein